MDDAAALERRLGGKKGAAAWPGVYCLWGGQRQHVHRQKGAGSPYNRLSLPLLFFHHIDKLNKFTWSLCSIHHFLQNLWIPQEIILYYFHGQVRDPTQVTAFCRAAQNWGAQLPTSGMIHLSLNPDIHSSCMQAPPDFFRWVLTQWAQVGAGILPQDLAGRLVVPSVR